MATHSQATILRLQQAMTHHYEQLKVLRRSRETFLSAAAGSLYPHTRNSDGLQDILGLMRQAAESMSLTMAAQQPKVMVAPSKVEYSAFSMHFENAIDRYSRTMHLGNILQDIVRNAFYCIGIAKIHMAEGAAIQVDSDEWMDPGRPFVESRSLTHMSYDTSAPDFRFCSFISDRYLVRLSDVLDNKEFKGSVRRQISQLSQNQSEAQQEEWGRSISGSPSTIGEWYDTIYLADCFCPKDGIVYTFPVDARYRCLTEAPLMTLEWDDEEEGPYRFLNLGPVPDKSTPSAPAQNLLLLHNLINTLYRKLRDQADRQKNVNVGPKGGEDDTNDMRASEDGDFITLNAPGEINQVVVDGPNQSNFAFALNAMQQFSRQAGNLEHQLGLGSQADTAAQEGMIGAGVGRSEAAFQARFVDFTRGVVKQLGKLLFNDQVTEVPMTRKVEGTDISYDDSWQGGMQENSRMGEMIDYDIDIIHDSMDYRSPRQRLTDIDETWDRVMAIAPMVMQMGMVPNVQEYLNLRARYTSTPEMKSLFLSNQMPPEQEGGGPAQGGGPGGGEYIHKSQPSGMGSPGTEDQAIQQMMNSSTNNRQTM